MPVRRAPLVPAAQHGDDTLSSTSSEQDELASTSSMSAEETKLETPSPSGEEEEETTVVPADVIVEFEVRTQESQGFFCTACRPLSTGILQLVPL